MPQYGVPDVRANWQKGAGVAALVEEVRVEEALKDAAAQLGYTVTVMPKPTMFHDLYYNYQRRKNPHKYERNDEAGAVWYDSTKAAFMKNGPIGGAARAKKTRNGLEPDLVVEHVESGARVVVEVKRQNAAGNAHQRLFRYFPLLPELSRLCRGVERPFVACICGPMSRDVSYIAEIQTGFDVAGMSDHVHFYRTHETLVRWARATLFPLLMSSQRR
jgi:hypothetical protein